MMDSRIQYKREQESARLEKAKEKEIERRRIEKGKGRMKDNTSPLLTTGLATTSPRSLPNSSHLQPRVNEVGTTASFGFTAIRSTLSRYLTRHSLPTSISLESLSFRSLIDYFRRHALNDPIRLISVLFTLFALSSWLRSKAVLRGSGQKRVEGMRVQDLIKLGLSKTVSTLRMGTKATTL